jgi:geranylgeranyl diphosphate synthase type II
MKLDDARADIDEALRISLSSSTAPKKLVEAMGYSLLAGGKRVRPLLVLASASSIDGTRRAEAMNAALAVEYVHTYSLIHDDLPALDDDDMRRGRPSLHKAFDEATAILAGDALLTDAFSLIASAPKNGAAQVRELASAAGSAGMVGGQVDDVAGAHDLAALTSIHGRKTGALFVAACAMGALAVDAPAAKVERLRAFGRHFGLAFQIADDVLDVTTGRGRDQANEKTTFATLLGLDEAKRRALGEADAALAIANELSSPALAELVEITAKRER